MRNTKARVVAGSGYGDLQCDPPRSQLGFEQCLQPVRDRRAEPRVRGDQGATAAEEPTSAGSGSSVSRRRSCSSSPINSADKSDGPGPLAVSAGS